MAKANRQKLQLHHTSSSVSYACLEHELVMYMCFINSMHNNVFSYEQLE
jgi:hypothetical protein